MSWFENHGVISIRHKAAVVLVIVLHILNTVVNTNGTRTFFWGKPWYTSILSYFQFQSIVIFRCIHNIITCKKNYSFSRVNFRFFSSSICQLFLFKKKLQQWSQSFSADGPGSSLCRAKYFYDFTEICQKFYSNGSHSTLGRTTGFCSGRFGFESLSCQIFSWFHWHFTETLRVPMAQWVGQEGFEAVGMGSVPRFYLHF